jgi:hypothetical protein
MATLVSGKILCIFIGCKFTCYREQSSLCESLFDSTKQAHLPANILLWGGIDPIHSALNLMNPRSTEEGSLEEEAGEHWDQQP